MRFDRTCKIEDAVDVNNHRSFLRHLYFDAEAKTLTTSDGHLVVVIPVELDDGDTSGFVSVEAIKAARKVKGSDPTILLKNDVQVVGQIRFPRPDPKIEGEFPSFKHFMKLGDESTATITFNAALLLKIQRAFGTNGVTLTFNAEDSTSQIRVSSITGKSLVAVLMPMRQ